MKLLLKVCDICVHENHTVRLAIGSYYSDETFEVYQVCRTHYDEIRDIIRSSAFTGLQLLGTWGMPGDADIGEEYG